MPEGGPCPALALARDLTSASLGERFEGPASRLTSLSSSRGFSISALLTFWAGSFVVAGAVLCSVGWLAVSLASPRDVGSMPSLVMTTVMSWTLPMSSRGQGPAGLAGCLRKGLDAAAFGIPCLCLSSHPPPPAPQPRKILEIVSWPALGAENLQHHGPSLYPEWTVLPNPATQAWLSGVTSR